MDVFRLRDAVIQDYAEYVRSFVQIRDRRIDDFVEKSLKAEVLWPQPLIQLNPSFEPGGWVDDLVERGVLHADCRKIFRIKTVEDPVGSRMMLHRHQVEAIEAARRNGPDPKKGRRSVHGQLTYVGGIEEEQQELRSHAEGAWEWKCIWIGMSRPWGGTSRSKNVAVRRVVGLPRQPRLPTRRGGCWPNVSPSGSNA